MIESAITPQQNSYKILLVGDNCVDTYKYGIVRRLSPEAPVPIFEPKYEIIHAGMAGNVYNNLKTLGCSVDYKHGSTSEKERLIDTKSKQHLLRIDRDAVCAPIDINVDDLSKYNAIVISDYNKGTITYELVKKIRSNFIGPVFVDTKKNDLEKFQGCYVKINEHEFNQAKSFPESNWLIVTYGENGAVYDGNRIATINVPLVDVTGAGDTFLSALTYMYLQSNNMLKSIEFANKAASITVQHVGVYAPKLEEIK